MNLVERTRTSLRLRVLATTLGLLALALGMAVFAFERVAQSVVTEAVHSHLRARALTVRNWSEAEAMQLTLDSGDPKFAEDHLRKTIQDQGGAVRAAALLD